MTVRVDEPRQEGDRPVRGPGGGPDLADPVALNDDLMIGDEAPIRPEHRRAKQDREVVGIVFAEAESGNGHDLRCYDTRRCDGGCYHHRPVPPPEIVRARPRPYTEFDPESDASIEAMAHDQITAGIHRRRSRTRRPRRYPETGREGDERALLGLPGRPLRTAAEDLQRGRELRRAGSAPEHGDPEPLRAPHGALRRQGPRRLHPERTGGRSLEAGTRRSRSSRSDFRSRRSSPPRSRTPSRRPCSRRASP